MQYLLQSSLFAVFALDTWRRKHKAETGCMAISKLPFFRNFRNFLTFDHMQMQLYWE